MLGTPSEYFKRYRAQLGFTSQAEARSFLAAKNVQQPVDMNYLNNMVQRLESIVHTVNSTIHESYRYQDIDGFVEEFVRYPRDKIVEGGLISRLNNQGRRPEEVLFSWLRGYVFCEFFRPAFSTMFDTQIDAIIPIGDDDFRSRDTFKRTPTADLELNFRDELPIVLEIQCGFQGENDIKLHKFQQAWRVFEQSEKPTLCLHFDLFNGQVAIVRLDSINNDDAQFFANPRMEGQRMLRIDQQHFFWRLLNPAPSSDLIERLISDDLESN